MSEKSALNPAQHLVLGGIRLYQRYWSPDHSWRKMYYPHGYCRFHPTCSEYAYEVITKYGAFKGGIIAFWRILRCNPWSKGGLDPVH